MILNKYYKRVYSLPILLGKSKIYFFLEKKDIANILTFKSLEVTLRIPSELSYEHGFISMLMLMEKMINNKVIFLLDKNTLSKKQYIKIGTVIVVTNEMMLNFFSLCINFFVYKFYDNNLFFSISEKNNILAYKISKILSSTIFSFDNDVSSYYDYLGELSYHIEFLFKTYCKSKFINKLLLSNEGINFINNMFILNESLFIEAEEMSLLEEFEGEHLLDEVNDSELEKYIFELEKKERMLNIINIE